MDRIGFIGLGTMGSAMAANIARAGFPLTVWNRTAGRAPELADLGATFATTAAEVAAASDIVVICVSDTPDVEAVLFGPDGVTAGAQRGHARHRLLDHRAVGELDVCRTPGRPRARLRRRPRFRRERGRPERDPDDLRRRARAGRRAGEAGADRAWPDDHPRRADRRRAGGQGGEPGHPGGRLPRGRRGDRPGDEGGPRRPAGHRGARWRRRADHGCSRTAAVGWSTTTTRSASSWRSTARTSASPSAWPTSSARACRWPR